MKKINLVFKTLFVASLCVATNASNAQTISTFAGTGAASFTGDGGSATAAQLQYANDVAFDASGNVYIADASNQRIRKVSTSGVITTIAGSGSTGLSAGGFSGDGGPATAARLSEPTGLAIDPSNNIYVVDNWNNRIRKINAAGVITTIAGSGATGYGAGGYSGDGGPATAARLSFPTAVAVKNGVIYIADAGNHRIRKIDTTGTITTIAGTGSFGFSGDGGPATAAKLSVPNCVIIDGSNNIYIADYGNERIRKISTSGVITTIAGTGATGFSGDGGPATAAKLSSPAGLAFDAAGNLLIADSRNQRIRKMTTAGIISTFAGTGSYGYSGDGGPAAAAQLTDVASVRVQGTDVYLADSNSSVVRRIYYSTATVSSSAASTTKMNIFPNPSIGSFTLKLVSATNQEAQVVVTNLLGQEVKKMLIASDTETKIDLPVPGGIYFVTATVQGEKIVEQILIQ